MNKISKWINIKVAYLGFKYTPKIFIKIVYKIKMKRKLNLDNPSTLSDKMNYLNLYDKNKFASICADKFEVREYVKNNGYENYLVRLLKVYDSVDEIDFNSLPNKFAMKCNHGCGYNIICTNKELLDINMAKNKLRKWIKEKYGYRGGEYHYNDIKPKIIVEEYIEGLDNEKLPIDYKIHCFNGKPIFTLCCFNREKELKLAVYDLEWNKVDAITDKYRSEIDIKKPNDYETMISIASKLSKPFKIIRIDFYELNGNALLGELTYTPAAGRPNYFKEEFDSIMGDFVEI